MWPWFGDLIEVEDENGESRFVRRPTKFMNHMLKKDRRSRLKSSCCIVPEIRNSVYKQLDLDNNIVIQTIDEIKN